MSDHRFDPLDRLAELFPDPGFTIERLEKRRARVRRRRAVVGGATATFGAAGVAALVAATMGFGGSNVPDHAVSSPVDSVPTTAPPAADPAPEPPVEFTVCAGSGDAVQEGIDEQLVIPDSGGEITLDRSRNLVIRLNVGDVPDPRLEGTWDIALSEDAYSGPQGRENPGIGLFVLRIENDEGAWQGSGTRLTGPGATFSHWVMLGEGSYEGLMIAATLDWDGCPGFGDVSGYIIDAIADPTPVPNSGS